MDVLFCPFLQFLLMNVKHKLIFLLTLVYFLYFLFARHTVCLQIPSLFYFSSMTYDCFLIICHLTCKNNLIYFHLFLLILVYFLFISASFRFLIQLFYSNSMHPYAIDCIPVYNCFSGSVIKT